MSFGAAELVCFVTALNENDGSGNELSAWSPRGPFAAPFVPREKRRLDRDSDKPRDDAVGIVCRAGGIARRSTSSAAERRVKPRRAHQYAWCAALGELRAGFFVALELGSQPIGWSIRRGSEAVYEPISSIPASIAEFSSLLRLHQALTTYPSRATGSTNPRLVRWQASGVLSTPISDRERHRCFRRCQDYTGHRDCHEHRSEDYRKDHAHCRFSSSDLERVDAQRSCPGKRQGTASPPVKGSVALAGTGTVSHHFGSHLIGRCF